MPYGLYISAEGAKAQSQRLEVLANNMANVNTVGFKPDVATFQSRFAEAIQRGTAMPGSRELTDVGGGVKVNETVTSYAPGQLQRTGGATDMAIIGNGFFQVAGPDGEALLTRAGNFSINANGTLTTADGQRAVLSAGGAPIQLNPEQDWRLTRTGEIEQDGTATPLAIVQPESLDLLNKVGANLFRSRGEALPVEAAGREVRSGYLEMSGANSTTEMMSLIETSRAFEANAKMIQNQDSMMSSLIGRVLRS
ncbi:Flagellar basal-body rod protein FlgG [Posidoniimonas polymericola]|uniref:Flagellar basal-body rod protein FlgG n=1 Tax=Posidoniimonas polymericola TaxID=2528002 RepID=A0A5C5YF18_9BACT|nr:flagellar hook-basal body protein [Posidoniimonas polymericola]TWT73529.1 Flagellar basal-body rod protein FlgG [Posidoniimonas polymericola]